MDRSEILNFQKILEEQKEKLIEEIKKESTPENFGDDVDSMDEESDEAEDRGNKLAAAQSLKEDVAEIDTALEKIKRNTYGICESCKNTIEKDVLAAAPESILCKNCKKAS